MFEFREQERAEIAESTDRGAALLAAAYLEAALETRLLQLMIHESTDNGSGKDILESVMGPGGTCGTAIGKANMAYVLGQISIQMLRDIKTIFKIRNLFAHRTDVSSFEHPAVQKVLEKSPFTVAVLGAKMTILVEARTLTTREQFLFAASEMAAPLSKRLFRPEFHPLHW